MFCAISLFWQNASKYAQMCVHCQDVCVDSMYSYSNLCSPLRCDNGPTAEVLEELPVAPSPQSRKLTNEELTKIEKQREAVLRELRIFLRDTTNKLLAERKFKEFVKPVDPEEVSWYTTTSSHT